MIRPHRSRVSLGKDGEGSSVPGHDHPKAQPAQVPPQSPCAPDSQLLSPCTGHFQNPGPACREAAVCLI